MIVVESLHLLAEPKCKSSFYLMSLELADYVRLRWRCSKCLSGSSSRRSSTITAPWHPKAFSVSLPASEKAGHMQSGTCADLQTPLQHPHSNLAPQFLRNTNAAKSFTSGLSNKTSEIEQELLTSKFLEVLDNHETEVFKQSREDLDRTDPPLEPPRISSNQSALAGKVVENSSYAAGISEKNRITLKRPNPERPERTEVPNTPTQHSSQLVIPDSAPEDQPQYSVGAGFGTVSPLTKSSQSGSIASSTVLCSICRKQRIFTKNSSDNVIWYDYPRTFSLVQQLI